MEVYMQDDFDRNDAWWSQIRPSFGIRIEHNEQCFTCWQTLYGKGCDNCKFYNEYCTECNPIVKDWILNNESIVTTSFFKCYG